MLVNSRAIFLFETMFYSAKLVSVTGLGVDEQFVTGHQLVHYVTHIVGNGFGVSMLGARRQG